MGFRVVVVAVVVVVALFARQGHAKTRCGRSPCVATFVFVISYVCLLFVDLLFRLFFEFN